MVTGKELLRSVFAKLISILLLCFLFNLQLAADETYPFSYSLNANYIGGKLFVFKNNDYYKSFFVKPTFGDFSESIFHWNGIRRDSVFGIPSIPPSVVASCKFAGRLLILSTESKRVFVSLINSDLRVETVGELINDEGFYDFNNMKFAISNENNEILVQINDLLYNIRYHDGKLISSLIAKKVLAFCFLKHNSYCYGIVKFEEGNGFVYLIDSLLNEKILCRVDLSDFLSIQQVLDKVVVISSSKYYNSSLFQIASFDQGIINKFWVETKVSNIVTIPFNENQSIFYLRNVESNYVLTNIVYEGFKNKIYEVNIDVPKELSEPYGLYLLDNKLYAIFHNGLSVFTLEGKILAKDFLTLGEYFQDNLEIEKIDNFLLLTTKSSSVVVEERQHKFWYLTRFLKNFGSILLPLVLSLILIYVLRKFYKQKRLLKALIEVPTTGVVFVVDKYGRLLAANNSGKEMLGITESVPLRRIFSYYCTMEHLKSLNELVEKVIASRESFVQKITFVKNKTDFEWLFTLLPLKSITGAFKGAVVTGIDITEVLGRQKLSNLAQLAHDMQTNLSTIRLNAEQLDINGSTRNDERRRKIIHQVGLLMQRVRDIVTVGRGEIVRQSSDAYDLCYEARLEFDDTMFPNVEFELDLQHFELFCDKPKMIRAIRNAIENAIKAFQGRPGKITIKNWKDIRNAYFSIKDNGPGMDKTMLDKFLKPYFTTGGTGIGTMIIQHVVELHGGTLKVISEKGKGTELLFIIPFLSEQRKTKVHKKEAT